MTYHPYNVDGAGNITVSIVATTTTVPISAVSLPLPSGASTSAKQPALGTAGSASADVITVQGITSMTPLKIDAAQLPAALVSGRLDVNVGSGSISVVTSTSSPLVVSGRDQPLLQDSFGRLEVSDAINIFSCKEDLQQQTLYWSVLTANGGTVTYDSTTSSNSLNVTTASGSRAVRRSKSYLSYCPGKGSSAIMTGVIGAGQTNTVKRIGLFDDNNGLFFELSGTTKRVVVRNNTVDTAIDQANWNIDKLDGTGVSGIDVNWTKAQIFGVNFQWLGVGRVVFYFIIQGKVYPCHQIFNANVITDVYMRTPLLSVQYEIVNTGATGANASLKQICSAIQTDGLDDYGQYFSCNNGVTTKSVNALVPVLQLRAKTATPNPPFRLKDIEVMTTSANYLYWQLALNPTGASGANFTQVHASSYFDYDVAATGTISGGQILMSGFLTTQTRISSRIDLGIGTNLVGTDINGNKDILCLAMATVGGGASNCVAALSWIEFA